MKIILKEQRKIKHKQKPIRESLCRVFRKTNVIDATHKETSYYTEHSGNNLFLKIDS